MDTKAPIRWRGAPRPDWLSYASSGCSSITFVAGEVKGFLPIPQFLSNGKERKTKNRHAPKHAAVLSKSLAEFRFPQKTEVNQIIFSPAKKGWPGPSAGEKMPLAERVCSPKGRARERSASPVLEPCSAYRVSKWQSHLDTLASEAVPKRPLYSSSASRMISRSQSGAFFTI